MARGAGGRDRPLPHQEAFRRPPAGFPLDPSRYLRRKTAAVAGAVSMTRPSETYFTKPSDCT